MIAFSHHSLRRHRLMHDSHPTKKNTLLCIPPFGLFAAFRQDTASLLLPQDQVLCAPNLLFIFYQALFFSTMQDPALYGQTIDIASKKICNTFSSAISPHSSLGPEIMSCGTELKWRPASVTIWCSSTVIVNSSAACKFSEWYAWHTQVGLSIHTDMNVNTVDLFFALLAQGCNYSEWQTIIWCNTVYNKLTSNSVVIYRKIS